MTLNLEMEYEENLDFDYEELAKKVIKLLLTTKAAPMKRKSTLF